MKQESLPSSRLIAILAIVLAMLMPINRVSAQNNSPLCFTARNGSVDVRFDIKWGQIIQYSTDSVNWSVYTSNSDVTISANQSVYFRAATNQTVASAFAYIDISAQRICSRFYFSSTNGGTVEGSGNIMSLYGPDCPNLPLQQYAFMNMFQQCSLLTTAPSLPATTLADYCYYSMFADCTSLTKAPALPAATLAKYSYAYMFQGCTSLTAAPALLASVMAEYCCQYMFSYCTSLTVAPSLPATVLARFCYSNMFSYCTSLTAAPSLPVTSFSTADYCYSSMFSHCTSLKTPPELPATSLSIACYMGMFSGCTSLTALPSLPTVRAYDRCYMSMFSGCTSLVVNTTAPGTQWIISPERTYTDALTNMFLGTSGTMNGTPSPGVTYYVASDGYIYRITANANDSTMGNVVGSGRYYYGDTITLTATPAANHHFVNWSNGDTARSISFVAVQDSTFTANFAINQHSITANVNDANMGSVTGAGSHNHGSTAILTAVPNANYHFVSWSNGKTTPSITMVVNGDSSITATFAIDMHAVTAIPNDSTMGSVAGSGTYNYGVSVTLIAIPKEHYHFVSWSNVATISTINVVVTKDSVLTAIFAIDQHRVSAYVNDANMGSVSGAGLYNYGDTATLTATANANYHFVSWSNGVTTPTISFVVTKDSAVTANFAIDTHNVTANVNDASMGSVSGDGTYNHGATATLIATPVEHYHFVSWSNGATTATINIVVVKDTALTATFAIDQHTVSTYVNDANMGSVTGAGTYNYGATATLSATANANYHFVSWSNGATIATINIVVAKDTALTATFAIDQHTVSTYVNDANMGSVTGAGTYNHGATATLTATANTNYHFVSWSNGKTTPTITMVVNGDSLITATFAIDQHTLTAISSDESMGSVTGSGTYNHGAVATITATTSTNYHFVSWSNGKTTPTITMVMNGDSVITASFAIDTHDVTAVPNDPAMGSVTGSGTYNHGATATLTATPNASYKFVSWSTGETTSTISVVVNNDISLTANFALNTFTVSVSSNDDNMGTVTGAGTYTYGDTATITAVANEHYKFVSWDNGKTNATLTFVVTQDVSLEATFEAIVYNVVASANYSNMGTVTGSGQYSYLESVPLTATPNQGYEFKGWSNGETAATFFLTVESDTVVTAIFAAVATPVDDIEEIEYIVYAEENQIVVDGATEVFIYDAAGKTIFNGKTESEMQRFAVPAAGIYFVRVDNWKNYRIVVK